MENEPNSVALRPHACVLCQRRKVKCDRGLPCSGCIKSQTRCEYRDPLPPRRRKKKMPEAEMAARLKRYEEALRKAGIESALLDDEDNREGTGPLREAVSDGSERYPSPRGFSTPPVSVQPENAAKFGPGRLIAKEGRSIYLDNHLWKSVSNELQDSEGILPEESTEAILGSKEREEEDMNGNFLFLGRSSRQSILHLHPNPIQIFKLWQVFLDGVNPLTKLLHAPTIQQRILDAASDLKSVSPELEALMFGIYCSAFLCMSDEEVRSVFGESKSTMLPRYRQAAQQALINAGVLGTSELIVLQAFLLFIISVRLVYNPHVLWSLCGVCTRIAQRIGLHKDGSKLGLSVFETEIRRRTWWKLMVVDATIGHMAGCESFAIHGVDTKTPSNLNDSSLDPDMKELPIESPGATEMIFCLMCYDLGMWLYEHSDVNTSTFDGYWQSLGSVSIALEKKDRMIDELEHVFETRYIRYCDPSIPLHLMTQVVARSVVALTRLRAHHPRQYQERGEVMPQSERALLFGYSKRVVDCANILFSSEKMLKFLWHTDFHFPWEPVIVMISEMREKPIGKEIEEGWSAVDKLLQTQFRYLGQGTKTPLHLAVANLAIKAWSAHVAECERRRIPTFAQPESITMYLAYLQRLRASNPSSHPAGPAGTKPATAASGPQYPESRIPVGQTPTPSDSVTTASESSNMPKGIATGTQNEPLPNDYKYPADPLYSDVDMSTLAEMYPVDNSPMDWVQWDDLLQQFQAQNAADVDILFPPPLG